MAGSGHLVSGQTLYVKLRDGNRIEDIAYRNADGSVAGGMKMANGTNSRGEPPFPGTRAKSAASVRQAFFTAREYADKVERAGRDPDKMQDRDLGMEALRQVLDGQRIVHHHTHRHDAIRTVLRLRDEFGFRVVLHHLNKARRVANEIAAAVGPFASGSIPAGMTVAEAAVVTPVLIDAYPVVGMVGYLSQANGQDQLEHSEAIQPELRAIDAYNACAPLVEWLQTYGITTIHTGHGQGEIISGQTLIAKTAGDTVEEAVLEPAAMVAATLGEGAVVEGEGRKSPGTRPKVAAMLRAELTRAAAYAAKRSATENDDDREPPPRDLRLDVLLDVISGKVPLLVTANRQTDIMTALRIAEEFDIRMVLDGAAESYLLIDEFKAAGIPVILHLAMAGAGGERENLSFGTSARLIDAGIPVAFQSGYEGYVPKTRNILFEAAVTLAYGTTFDQALAAITIDADRILGIGDRVGSIEIGKDGDLAMYDGDPFEFTSHAVGTIIDGVRVSDRVK